MWTEAPLCGVMDATWGCLTLKLSPDGRSRTPLIDRGAITISDQLKILVSSRLHGAGKLDEFFPTLHGVPLPIPGRKEAEPKREFLEWHRAEVFRGLARS